MGAWKSQTVHRWLNVLTIMVGLWIALACGVGHRRPYGASIRRMPDGHQHRSVSPDRVQHQRHCSAERRGDGGAVAWISWREGSSPWGRSGPTTPATVNRSRRGLREERGRKALGRGAVRYQNGPRQMTFARSTAGINKEEEPAQDTANHVHRCVAAGFPDDVGQALAFHGWICQETLCGRISVTFLNEVTGRQD